MNKRGILPVVLVSLVGLAGLTVLMLGTVELLHGTLTGAAAQDEESVPRLHAPAPSPRQAEATYLSRVVVRQPGRQDAFEECVLTPLPSGDHALQCAR